MVGAQDVGAVGEGLFVQGDGLVEFACLMAGLGEVVS